MNGLVTSNPFDEWLSPRGRILQLRRGRLDDVDRFLEFERHLSPGTKYFRFGRFRDLPFTREQTQRILDPQSDNNLHFVVTMTENSTEEILASARVLFSTSSPIGELMLVVRDDWHGSGLGRRLTATLCGATSLRGIPRVYCQVLPTNFGMQAFMPKCGFQQVHNPDNEVLLRYEKRLDCVATPPA